MQSNVCELNTVQNYDQLQQKKSSKNLQKGVLMLYI